MCINVPHVSIRLKKFKNTLINHSKSVLHVIVKHSQESFHPQTFILEDLGGITMVMEPKNQLQTRLEKPSDL